MNVQKTLWQGIRYPASKKMVPAKTFGKGISERLFDGKLACGSIYRTHIRVIQGSVGSGHDIKRSQTRAVNAPATLPKNPLRY